MTAVVVCLLGALFMAGVVLVVGGLRRVHLPRRPRTPTKPLVSGRVAGLARAHGVRLLLGLGGGVVLALLTGMSVMVIVVPIAVLGLPLLLGTPSNRDIELLQALDRWVRGLAATLPTGKSITDAIRISQRQAPEALAQSLHLLVARLDDRWTPRQALLAMADELASADADAVLVALALAAQRGGTGATATLSALADSIQDRLRALREIETERAKPRVVVRQVTGITVTVLVAAMIFGRDFFAPYGTPIGQLILVVMLTVYVGSLVVLRRMTMPRRRDRIARSAA